jgi:hypothetical protein
MSEYQYDEFRAIDRALNDRQMRELREISTRATISRTSFSNDYTFGDLNDTRRKKLRAMSVFSCSGGIDDRPISKYRPSNSRDIPRGTSSTSAESRATGDRTARAARQTRN